MKMVVGYPIITYYSTIHSPLSLSLSLYYDMKQMIGITILHKIDYDRYAVDEEQSCATNDSSYCNRRRQNRVYYSSIRKRITAIHGHGHVPGWIVTRMIWYPVYIIITSFN
jgi:hypothetical protein